MPVAHTRSRRVPRPSLAFGLLLGFLAVLWFAGGASRADVPGQLVARGASWIVILVLVVLGRRPDWRSARPVLVVLGCAAALVFAQLTPLPPAIWAALPGRAPLLQAATLAGLKQPWRPLAIAPDATLNAGASLVAPLAAILLMVHLSAAERARLPATLLIMIAAAALVGLLQVSGAGFANPLVNYPLGDVSGAFANRNHFALLMAVGCLISPVWAVAGGRIGWRAILALCLALLFLLMVLASGSRAGIPLAGLGLAIGLGIARARLGPALSRAPRWMAPGIVIGAVAVFAATIALSVAADRAMSVQRLLEVSAEGDLRARALPTVWAMIVSYFPIGSGFGGFDPVFRMHEPLALLQLTYFNHAHNDYAEVVLDGGLPGLALLVGAIGWWAAASVRTWRADRHNEGEALARLGSAILLLAIVSATVDFAARTPLFMTLIAIAAGLLAIPAAGAKTLPKRSRRI